MAVEAASLYATLGLNASGYERGLQQARGSLHSFGGALGNVASVAGGMLVAGVFTKLAGGVASFGRSAIEAVGNAQTLEMQLEGLLAMQQIYVRQGDRIVSTGVEIGQAMEIAGGQAQDLLDFISELSVISPFETRQVEQIARIGLAADMSSMEVKDFTRAFLDFSATMGIGSADLAFAADQFLQLRKIGKLTTIDLRQLRRLGIDVEKILGAKMGMSVEQFNEQVERSPELMDRLFESFIEFSGEVSAGAAERMTQTLPGMMSTAHDIIEVGSRKLFQPMVEALTPTLSNLIGKIAEFATGPKMQEIGQRLGNALKVGISLVQGDITGAAEGMLNLGFNVEQVQQMIDTYRQLREMAINTLAGIILKWGELKETFSAGWQRAEYNPMGYWESVGIGPSLERLGEVWRESLQPALQQLEEALAPLMGDMTAWEIVLGLIAEVMQGIADSIDQIAAAAEWAAPRIEAIAQALKDLKTIVDELGTSGALEAIGQELFPKATVGTGNVSPGQLLPNWATRQFGGPVAAHQPYLVGERGPELFVPGQSGQVVPNGQMTVDVPIVLQLDGDVIARALGRRAARFATTGAAARL